MRIKIVLVTFTLLFFGHIAWAQSIPEDIGTLTISVSPSTPGPHTTVNLRLTNYLIDLGSADIHWYVDGNEMARGVGMITFSTKTGNTGEKLTITALATTKDGKTLRKNMILRPAIIDLLWQADSSVPPLYHGKALPTTKNNVTFVALPHFGSGLGELDPSKLMYEWELDFEPVPSSSGIGKSIFNTRIVDLIGDSFVSVQVSSLDGGYSANTSISLSPNEPEISIYQVDPLLGTLYNTPITNNFNLAGQEVTLRALGYNFPKSHLVTPGLSYKFTVGGKPALISPTRPDTLTLRLADNSEGNSTISASINDPFDSFISAVQNIVVNFGSNFQNNSISNFQ